MKLTEISTSFIKLHVGDLEELQNGGILITCEFPEIQLLGTGKGDKGRTTPSVVLDHFSKPTTPSVVLDEIWLKSR